MRGWWREKDFSAVLKEQLITCEMDANSIVAKVYADLLKEEQKMRHDIIEYVEINSSNVLSCEAGGVVCGNCRY